MSLFGEELRRLRRRSGLSQETLADRAGLSAEAVSLLERGRRQPRVTTMRLLIEALGLPEEERAALFSTLAPARSTNSPLPVYTDPIVGRSAEVAALQALVHTSGTRLVTLYGPGGVGKTRVAVAFAAEELRRRRDPVHWLPSGVVQDTAGLLPALASALGVQGALRPDLGDIVAHLASSSALLLIDNAEHHLDFCVELCAALLREAPGVQIVLSSRHLLQLPGEVAFPVHPLALPPDDTAPQDLTDYAASELFCVRARLPAPLTDSESAAVVDICRLLDGLPLALELAAARTNVMTVSELAVALQTEPHLLAAPGGGEQLVDAVVGWSYSLLGPAEQLVFAKLSVFDAAFSREAVGAVCGEGFNEAEVLDILSALVSKSLVVRRDDGGDAARFRLLQLIRTFARARLEELSEAAETYRRHAHFFAGLVERARPGLVSAEQSVWLDALDREVVNLRRAISWATAHEPELGLQIVGALDRWCYVRGRYTLGRSWATAALHAAPDAPAGRRATVLAMGGNLAFLQCDYVEAGTAINRAKQLYSAVGDRAGAVWASSRLGSIARELGDYDRAGELHLSAFDLAERRGDDHEAAAQLNLLCFVGWVRGDWDAAEPLGQEALRRMRALGDTEGVSWSLINLGCIARYRGEEQLAERLLRRSHDLVEQISFREGLAWTLNQLGVLARLRGEGERAVGLQQASLAEHLELGDRWRTASVHDELAAVAVTADRLTTAAWHLGTADRFRAEIGVPVPAVERTDRERTENHLRQALGTAYEGALLAGRLEMPPPDPAAQRPVGVPDTPNRLGL